MVVDMILRCMGCIIVIGMGLVAPVRSQDQSGFISIDCGLPDESNHRDPTTTILYTSDTEFTTAGTNKVIARVYQTDILRKQLVTVRSFPQGTRNCYTLTPSNGAGTNYLIRAWFMYGNYDSINKAPTFDLHIGVDVWDTIQLDNCTQVVVKELIHTPHAEYLDVCLVNTGDGVPFISSLELRPLDNTIYTRESGSLDLVDRYYTFNTSNQTIRYSDDVYDRIWMPGALPNGSSITTSFTVDTSAVYKLPPAAMSAAMTRTVAGSKTLEFTWTREDPTGKYYVYFHFAELQTLRSNETREFDILVNGLPLLNQPVSPLYLVAQTFHSDGPLIGSSLHFTFAATERSTHPPIINAFDRYVVRELSQQTTNQADVLAMMGIKSKYDVTKNWQGDPCSPVAYRWSGVNCSYDSLTATITSLNLSSSGLKGEIATSISNLTSLQVLDLSNNELTGGIPDFLADLVSLKTLYLGGNIFTSTTVPPALIEKSNAGLLDLSLENNRNGCAGGSCSNKNTKKLLVIVAGSISVVVVVAAVVICTVCLVKKKKQYAGGATKKGGLFRFSHSEVTEMTMGFEKQLGKGGHGTVYYGHLKDGTGVAVKLLQQSIQGSEQFETEIELLMAIRHKNLVSLIGYCDEENNLALIYEYMANCDLQSMILGSDKLSWKQRLHIAIDSAQGLDYLHNGCRPPIVHRDVKTPNILLNDSMQAKVADFGLSKIFPDEDRSRVTTRVIGTPGYLDPEYSITEQLNEKSDVYSFGVVLLELLTGKPAIITTHAERTTLIHWVSPMLEGGDVWSIVDQRLQDVGNHNSIWMVADIIMACVKPTSSERPTMSQIVIELKECLAMEMEMATQRNLSTSIVPNYDPIGIDPMSPLTEMKPEAR